MEFINISLIKEIIQDFDLYIYIAILIRYTKANHYYKIKNISFTCGVSNFVL